LGDLCLEVNDEIYLRKGTVNHHVI
jgi:hypothetical protein